MISIEQLMRRLARDAQTPGEMVQLSLAGQLPYDAAPAMPMALGGPPRPSAQPAPDATPTPSAGRMADMSAPEPVRVAQGPSIPGNALLDLSMGLHGGRPGGISGALGMLMAGPEQRAAQAQQMQRQQAEQNLTIEAIRKRHPNLDPNVAAVIAKTPKLMQEYLSIPDPMKGMTNDVKNYERAKVDPEFRKFLLEDKKAGATNINNTVKTSDGKFVEAMGTEGGKYLYGKAREDAQAAASSLMTISDARKALDSGVIAGFGAKTITKAAALLGRLGITGKSTEELVDRTQAYAANMGREVGNVIRLFGSGTGLSDADREYAEAIAGGNIDINEGALRRILEMGEKVARARLKSYNEMVQQVPKEYQAFPLGIDVPEVYTSPKAPQQQQPAQILDIPQETTPKRRKWNPATGELE